ncbi:MAG: putative toxin-antitoxin system toxin component, PIN family [Flavobacteriales bacterium]
MRLVVDNNVLISTFIGGQLAGFFRVLESEEVRLFTSRDQVAELMGVLERPKFRKYFSESKARLAVDDFCDAANLVEGRLPIVTVCRDPKDNYLLALSKAAKADLLITGDEDLLVLKKFGRTEVITPAAFMARRRGA